MIKFIKQRDYLIFLLIFSLYAIFLAVLVRSFYFYQFNPRNLFILDLIGVFFQFPVWAYYLFGLGSFLLFYLITLKLFSSRLAFYSLIVYAISPWFHYLTVFRSFYIYLMFLLLSLTYGLVLIRKKSVRPGTLIVFVVSLLLIFSDLIFALIYLGLSIGLFFISLRGMKVLDFSPHKIIRYIILIFLIIYFPLGILTSKRPQAFDNIYHNQITIFSDPGLLGESNRLQGNSKQLGNVYLAKLSENKYFYLSKYLLLKLTKHFTLPTYFTPQEKLLNFSFSPPIFLGFLIPFVYGLFSAFKISLIRKYFLVTLILVTPSMLSQKIVDLNRLVLIGPVIVCLISYGITNLTSDSKLRKKSLSNLKWRKPIMIIVLLLVLIQLGFTISDINNREELRYRKYFGDNLVKEIGRQ